MFVFLDTVLYCNFASFCHTRKSYRHKFCVLVLRVKVGTSKKHLRIQINIFIDTREAHQLYSYAGTVADIIMEDIGQAGTGNNGDRMPDCEYYIVLRFILTLLNCLIINHESTFKL